MLVRKMVSMSEKHGPAKMTDCPKRRPRTVMLTGKPYMLSLTFNGREATDGREAPLKGRELVTVFPISSKPFVSCHPRTRAIRLH